MTIMKPKLTGDERLLSLELEVPNSTVLDFWQWAFSDLKANNLRGVFAEWLVARLLQIDQPVRDSWAAWDLETPEGVKIEVKAAAYLQAWEQKGLSNIVFSGLKGRTWDPLTGYSESPTYNAGFYIFCLQIEKNEELWNPLDLSQWVFYVLPKGKLAELNLKTVSLKTLEGLTKNLTSMEFCLKVPKILNRIPRQLDRSILLESRGLEKLKRQAGKQQALLFFSLGFLKGA